MPVRSARGRGAMVYDTTGLTAYQTPPTQGLAKEVRQSEGLRQREPERLGAHDPERL